jgi:sodium transport system ATP-binding protein
MESILLRVRNISKNFGELQVLNSINFEINKGEIIGLVGSNGAGKTTLLRLLSGVYNASVGEIIFDNGDTIEEARQRIGVVPESTGLYSRLTAWENIRYHSRLYGVSDEFAWRRTSKLAEPLGMTTALSRHTKGFSRGMRQKTALLRALAHSPHLLLLDEPTSGLDITSARTLRKLILKLKEEGGAVIYSTHQLAEAEQICTRIIIIHNGEIRADGTVSEILERTKKSSLEEAYVHLTMDDARPRFDNDEKTTKLSAWWRQLFTGRLPPNQLGGDESE